MKTPALIVFSSFPIAIGTAIYILWRPDTLLVFQWARWLGVSFIVSAARELTAGMDKLVPPWVIFSLPNALWVFSYSLVVTYLWWREDQTVIKFLWLLSPLVLGAGFELLQLARAIPGTFCQEDLLFAVVGVILGWLCSAKFILKEDC